MHGALEEDRLYVATDILILTVRDGRLCLLLSRRVDPPYAGRWALPGTFIGLDESAETAAKRLLAEMLPIQRAFLEQLFTFTDVNRDPRGRVISVAYLVVVPWERLKELMAEKDARFRCCQIAMDGNGLSLTDDWGGALIPGDLAFDHGRIIETGILRLRGKIDYTDIGFRFLNDPRAFSLGELQTVFEAVLGEPLDSSNFRRAIMSRYEKTGRLTQTDQAGRRGRGRPAALYRFNL
ncbi:MAG: NUDIX domain-containing protein [Clostridia bacterium]|nr:NUDIX domain-containing protein [Clostridia bacterium]